jgi:hypothetical protein
MATLSFAGLTWPLPLELPLVVPFIVTAMLVYFE